MIDYHGHRDVVAQLETELPPVTLLLGPPSVGKWTLTQYLAERHGVLAVDHSAHPTGFTADSARAVRTFVQRAPLGKLKLVTARLDRSTPTSWGVLLKTLEEPPAPVRFLLTCDTWTTNRPALPGTITSRAAIYPLGLLADYQVAAILIANGMNPLAAQKAARLGGGQVRPARDALAVADDAKDTITTLMNAVAAGDRDQLTRAMRNVDDSTAHLLGVWLGEALTRRWKTFTAPDALPPRRELFAALAALRRLGRGTPRLAVHAALDAITGQR